MVHHLWEHKCGDCSCGPPEPTAEDQSQRLHDLRGDAIIVSRLIQFRFNVVQEFCGQNITDSPSKLFPLKKIKMES